MLLKRLAIIVFLRNRDKEAIQSLRLKKCAKGSITWYGVTPQVYWFNKSDYKGNVSLGRLPLGRRWKHPRLKLGHLNPGWIRKKLLSPWTSIAWDIPQAIELNVFPCSGSYFTTISQKVTYISKVLKEYMHYLLASPWWAYSQVIEDLKEKKNRLSNKYWLWLNGFKHKHRIVIKIRPHKSNDSQLRFMEFMRTPPPPLSLLILSSRVLPLARVFSMCC